MYSGHLNRKYLSGGLLKIYLLLTIVRYPILLISTQIKKAEKDGSHLNIIAIAIVSDVRYLIKLTILVVYKF